MIQTSQDALERTANHLRGVPYKHYGRTEKGLDCFGLVLLFFKHIGVEIADQFGYDEGWFKTNDLISNYTACNFELIPDPVPGAVAAMRWNSKMPNHLLVVVAPGKFLHCTSPVGVHYMKTYPAIMNHIVWFKKHSELQIL